MGPLRSRCPGEIRRVREFPRKRCEERGSRRLGQPGLRSPDTMMEGGRGGLGGESQAAVTFHTRSGRARGACSNPGSP